jgi:hypothetical protein
MKWIDFLFSKERDERKEGIINIIKSDLSELSEHDLIRIKEQLELIIEEDDTDIRFFAKKLNSRIMDHSYKNGINLSKKNEVEEVYEKNSEDLIKLLSSDEKIIRINALYALAKNGCSQKHIISLEKFAEQATEDESILAIEAIEAIKRFIIEKKQKEEARLKKRQEVLKSLRNGKENREINLNSPKKTDNVKKIQKNIWTEEKKPKKSKAGVFYLFILILTAVYHLYFSFIFNPSSFIRSDQELYYYNYSLLKPVIIYKSEEDTKIMRLTLSFKGWIQDE